MAKPIEPLESRLARLTDKSGECWLWTGSLDAYGYGQIGVGRSKKLKAHRVAWELANHTAVPEGLGVLHRCDTPSCVNPKHLFVGTQADNLRDCREKGRVRSKFPRFSGSEHPASKLTEEQRAEIMVSTETQRDLAERYGVRQSTICRVQSSRGSKKRKALHDDLA